jgi:hypothetical protein
MSTPFASASPQSRIWRDRADALVTDGRVNGQQFIEGQRVDAAAGETFACHSPIDGRHLAEVARGRSEDVDRAVKSAAGPSRRPPHARRCCSASPNS